ncbi:outer membrane lipoprotein carrier protein LolA [Roseobacter sp. YSTF-M11]|uniref:Outer membrane lipoprotein carrier protein LolA n=1 Tax=Roseobacter insulae TaxID=2859783 RepID=A0A9X1FRU6_9RHOB|nr:outer membrane lipoprotein carrier protein LolA [Roseobacter insulae]MBW4706550.1 outer membrane lipoprotein carrier protein LolA [Roseobacter insulae]
MKRLIPAILTACLGIFSAMPALAEKLSLNEISGYLNDLITAQGAFTQINDDGTISSGKLFIKRPGKMRFEYDPPEQALVLADANTVVIIDKKSNQPPESYPLSRTPLSLILARQVNLGRARMVTGHDYDGTATIVTAQDPDNPDTGSIRMSFTDNPVQLRQWIIDDANGGQTTVILGEFEAGLSLRNSLFDPGRALRERDR